MNLFHFLIFWFNFDYSDYFKVKFLQILNNRFQIAHSVNQPSLFDIDNDTLTGCQRWNAKLTSCVTHTSLFCDLLDLNWICTILRHFNTGSKCSGEIEKIFTYVRNSKNNFFISFNQTVITLFQYILYASLQITRCYVQH